FSSGKNRLWQDGKTATNTGEATSLGEAAKLNRAFARTINFENRMGNLGTADVGFVGGIEQQQRIMVPRVLDPIRQLRTRRHRAGWIVGKTKINDVRVFPRRFRNEIILNRAGQIENAFVAAIGPDWPGVPRHYIGIDVNWIDRIGNRDLILLAQNIENVTAVAFRPIRQENFVIRHFDSTIAIIKLRDFVAEEFVALLGPVATEGFTLSEFFGRSFHCLDRGPRQRLSHVTDATTN